MFRLPARPTRLLPVLLMLASCSGPDARPDALEGSASASDDPEVPVSADLAADVLDSAGVVIRRSPAAALERTAYRIAAVPDLLIDGSEGGGQPLHAVGALAFGPGGAIAIAERGEMGVRIHAADGRRLRVIGRDGQGPGEFGALNGLGFRADSMFVFDSRWFRISVFDPDGEYVRQVVPESAWGDRPRWFAFAPEGGIVTTSRGGGGDLVWGIHGFDGSPLRSFPDAPSPATPTMARLAVPTDGSRPANPLRLFAPQPVAGPWRDGIAVTAGSEYRIELRDGSGRLAEVWSVADALPRRVTPADVEAARRRAVERTDPDLRAVLERRWSNVDPAERFPAFGAPSGIVFTDPPQIIEAAGGELWIRAYPAPEEDSADAAGWAPRWWVFRADGTLLGSVDFPPRFELHAVGEAGALGVVEDEYDVQRVALFGLESGSGAGPGG